MTEFQPSPRPQYSPWGQPDETTQVANGIWNVYTRSHGGYKLSEERVAAMPSDWLARSFNGQGQRGWFEEDVDWCLVALAFPEDWLKIHGAERGAELLEAAKKTFNEWIAKKENAA